MRYGAVLPVIKKNGSINVNKHEKQIAKGTGNDFISNLTKR